MDIRSLLSNDQPLSNNHIDQYYTMLNTGTGYRGCIYINELKNQVMEPGDFFIINLGNAGNGGTHWVMLYRKSKGVFIYYDSFGVGVGKDILRYIKKNNASLHYNTEDNQNIDSSRCGFYNMFVADMLADGKSFREIINLFTADPSDTNIDILNRHFA